MEVVQSLHYKHCSGQHKDLIHRCMFADIMHFIQESTTGLQCQLENSEHPGIYI